MDIVSANKQIDMTKEKLIPMYGHKGYYVTESGKIIGKQRTQLVGSNVNGYQYVTIRVDGKTKRYPAHRLILQSFLGRPLNKGYEVHHRNGHKNDNRLCNLAEVTHKENMNDFDTKQRLTAPRKRYSFKYEEIE